MFILYLIMTKHKVYASRELVKKWKYANSYKQWLQLRSFSQLVPDIIAYTSYQPEDWKELSMFVQFIVYLLVICITTQYYG